MLLFKMQAVEPRGVGRRKRQRGLLLLLVLPYVGLCFPQLYVRATPTLFGFPFFYWYQFAWVLLTSWILLVFYRRGNRERAA
jgi:hypothetical protein